MSTSTATIASALRMLANDIQSPDTFRAPCPAIEYLFEAADRLEQLERTIAEQSEIIANYQP
jgi:hypothetical protein